jgi:hypothetical protein
MAEDSGAFKTNQVNSAPIPAFVIARADRCNEAAPAKNALFGLRHGYSRFRFNKRPQTVAVSLNQPDSLRQRGSLRCERGQFSGHRVPDGSRAFANIPAKAESASMLPGFRFLLAAIVLSMSILIFGLGAAALLRAAHEEFASIPLRHAAPETVFAQQPGEAAKPVLALLRIEPPAAEQNVTEKAPAEPVAIAPPPDEPEKVATLKPEEASQPETAKQESSKPEIPVAEAPAQTEAAPSFAEAPASVTETKVATTEQPLLPANQAASPAPAVLPPQAALPEPAASPQQAALPQSTGLPQQAALPGPEEASAPVSPDTSIAATKIATLGGPPVTIGKKPLATAAGAKPDDAAKKREEARKAAAKRRRMAAARARMVAQQTPKLPLDPFGQPTITARTR